MVSGLSTSKYFRKKYFDFMSKNPLFCRPVIIDINNAKNAIFEILAKFGTMFRDEKLEIEQKPEDMLKRLVLAS